MPRLTAVLIALVVALAIAASPAAAQSAFPQAYSTPAGQVQSDVSSGGGDDGRADSPRRVSEAASSSHLPFTGLDVGLLLAVGLALLLVGAGLSRLTAAGAGNRRS